MLKLDQNVTQIIKDVGFKKCQESNYKITIEYIQNVKSNLKDTFLKPELL